MYGVLLWAGMHTATQLGAWGRSVMSLGQVPYLWPAFPVFQVVSTMKNVWARLACSDKAVRPNAARVNPNTAMTHQPIGAAPTPQTGSPTTPYDQKGTIQKHHSTTRLMLSHCKLAHSDSVSLYRTYYAVQANGRYPKSCLAWTLFKIHSIVPIGAGMALNLFNLFHLTQPVTRLRVPLKTAPTNTLPCLVR